MKFLDKIIKKFTGKLQKKSFYKILKIFSESFPKANRGRISDRISAVMQGQTFGLEVFWEIFLNEFLQEFSFF